MVPSSGRRQNASCDQCRRSKKRCAFDPGTQPGSGALCQNCAHLGHRCTFNFVTARQAVRKRKIMSPSNPETFAEHPSPQTASELAALAPSMNSGTIWTTSQPPMEEEMFLEDMIWPGLGPTSFLDFDSLLDSDSQGWMDLSESIASNDTLEKDRQNSNDTETALLSLTESQSQPPRKQRYFEDGTLCGFWHGSPIQLLNSTATTEEVTKNLCHVYDTMMIGLASRYLSYVCNQFAGTHGYIIEPESPPKQVPHFNPPLGQLLPSEMSSLNAHSSQVGWGQIVRQSPKEPVESFRRITLIGVARFLDNFGTLYGNRLDKKKRKLDEATFMSVLQAFALQFASPDDSEVDDENMPTVGMTEAATTLPSTVTKNQVFATSWFNAHSHLVKSINHRSFVHLYSVFVFHMTAKPEEVCSQAELSGSSLRLLDRALHQLKSLTALLSDFCSDLDSQSLYRGLLESSHRIFYWFGYVRDTMASLISERCCVLDDLPVFVADTTGAPIPYTTLSPPTLDEIIPETSQKANRCIFSLFRQTSRVTSLLELASQQHNQSKISASITSLTKAVDAFHTVHDGWMEQCLTSFLQVSTQSKQSAGFLMLFWNLGVLRVVEVMKSAGRVLHCPDDAQTMKAAIAYEKRAVQKIVALSERINETSEQGDFRLSDASENKLPLISHHAHTGLTVLALAKAIEHAISCGRLTESPPTRFLGSANSPLPNPEVMASIKPLLKCLSTLHQTISGACVARPALHDLLRRYGDIILDCWDEHSTEM